MQTLREEVKTKLHHILHDIKDLQKTIIRLGQEERAAGEERISAWQGLGKEISAHWSGASAVDEIREQRDKKW